MFALSVFARGLRFGDSIRLQWDDIKDGRIQIIASKTGDHLNIPVDANLDAILSNYKGHSQNSPYVFPALVKPLPAGEREGCGHCKLQRADKIKPSKSLVK